MTQRKFRPRKKLPRDKLEKYLQEGYTLKEIAREFGVAISYVSEYMKMLGIKKEDFQDREKKKNLRKKQKVRSDFIEEFWELIRFEIGR